MYDVHHRRKSNMSTGIVGKSFHFRRFAAEEEPVVNELESWGDDSRTLELYQKIGFAISRQEAIYRWDLR
jgi:hypothetical protein